MLIIARFVKLNKFGKIKSGLPAFGKPAFSADLQLLKFINDVSNVSDRKDYAYFRHFSRLDFG